MEKLKVLMVGPAPPQLGGMEAFIGELLKTDLTAKVNLYLLDISKPKLTNRRSNREVIGYETIYKRKIGLTLLSYSYSFAFFFKYIYQLVKFRPDIVHIHTASYTSFWDKILYVLFARLFGFKVVLHSHGGFFSKFYETSSVFGKYLIRKTLNSCDMIFVLSESWLNFFQSIVQNKPIYIIPNGIHLDRFQINNNSKTNRPSFLFVGRVGEPKGVYELLDATSRIIKDGYDCALFLMGAGELSKVKDYANELEIAENVEILGPKYAEEKNELFSKTWCFVLPSHAEGMPITILEAFAAGLPVISTKVGSIPSVVKDRENGFLFEKQQVEQLADCMVRIIKDEDLRLKMSENNVIAARQNYNIQNSASTIYANYKRLLNDS